MGSIVLSVLALALAAGPAPQDAKETATRLLEEGSLRFDERDTAAMVSSYTEDAEITLLSRKDGDWQSLSYRGTDRIRQIYTDLFKNAGSIRSKNVVEYARFAGPDVLVIAGTFEPNMGQNQILQFVQIRVRDDGDWKIKDLQLFPTQ